MISNRIRFDVQLAAVDKGKPSCVLRLFDKRWDLTVRHIASVFLQIQSPPEVISFILTLPGTKGGINERECQNAGARQHPHQPVNQFKHLGLCSVRENRIGNDEVEAPAQIRELQVLYAVRIEE